ncbi:MAG: O-antigen polymerase [Verrucomicrobia bacterium]|nr:O-antigen polymerase [Verrucomicrobiota bacterium]
MSVSVQTRRASIGEWIQAGLIAVNLAWTTLCLGGFRPETMVVTSALNGLLLLVHLGGRAASRREVRPLHAAGWWMLPFLIYAAANVIWLTPVPWLGWRDWLGWAQMIVIFWVVLNGIRSTATRAFLFGSLAAVAVATVALACYQRFVKPDWMMLGRIQVDQFIGRSSGSFGIPNSLAALLLLLIPPFAALAIRRGANPAGRLAGGFLTLVFGLGLILTISRGAWLSLAVVAAAWPVFASQGSAWRRLGMAMASATAVAVLFAIGYFSMPSVRERFVQMKNDAGERTRPIMWRGAWQIFREHPAWGGGAGSYNVLFEKFRPAHYQDEPMWAHNDYLNTLSDYGAVGFGLFFGIGAALGAQTVRKRRRRERDWLDDPLVAGGLVAGMVAFGLQLFVDFHFKIPALAMAFALVAALVVQRFWPETGEPQRLDRAQRTGLWMTAAGLVVALLLAVTPFYRGEALRYGARQAIDRLASNGSDPIAQRSALESAKGDLVNSLKMWPANAQAAADLSYATSLWAHTEPASTAALGKEAEKLADAALARSLVVPEFWIRRGVALDMQGRRPEGGAAFVQAVLLAPSSAHTWYYQAYHLSLNKSDAGLALAAVDFCLRLDPGNGEAQLLRQRLASGRRTP